MKKLTKKQIEKMAYDIRKFLLEHSLWVDVTIYFNGKALSTDDRNGHYGYNDPDKVFLLEDQDPRKYFPYFGDILGMSFEGDFYYVLNYDAAPKIRVAFNELLARYGVYYELGNAWNLSVFPIPY